MKNIKEYLNKDYYISYKLPNKNGFRTFEEFMELNGYTEENISEHAIQFFYNRNWSNYPNRNFEVFQNNLYETLTSHNVDSLINKLSKEIKDIINIEKISNKKSDALPISVFIKKDNNIINDESIKSLKLLKSEDANIFEDILTFFNYYISEIIDSIAYYEVLLEPVFTTKINNKGIKYIYHITNRNNIQKIKTLGLRPNVGKTREEGGYRYFTKRLFFVTDKNGNNQLINDLEDEIKDLELDNKKINKKYSIIRVDISKYNIDLYKDAALEAENAVYVHIPFRKELLEYFNSIDELKEYLNKD